MRIWAKGPIFPSLSALPYLFHSSSFFSPSLSPPFLILWNGIYINHIGPPPPQIHIYS